MSELWLLPRHEVVGHLLRDLVGKPVTSKKIPGPLGPGPFMAGAFVRDDGSVSAACVLELQLAANLAAALVMAPPAVAKDAVKAKKLDEMMMENVREVLNVGSRWFMPDDTAPHVKLKDVFVEPLPKAILALMKLATRSRLVEIEVPGYAGGKLGIFSL